MPDRDNQSGGLREKLHEIIFESDTPAGKVFDTFLIAAILLSVTVVILSTMSFARDGVWRDAFYITEWVFTALFTLEYIVRLLVVKRPMRYATSFYGIIDLLSILPAFIGLVVPGGERLLVVRMLRLLRVFRVFKLARYLSEASNLRKALLQSRHKITVFVTFMLIVVVISSALMHLVEGNAGNEDFDSMPDAMYWSVITMTTVGYGDVTPQTGFGKFATAALVLIGYSMIIVPTGIVSAEIASRRAGRVTGQACRSCMSEDHDADAKFCKMCGEAL